MTIDWDRYTSKLGAGSGNDNGVARAPKASYDQWERERERGRDKAKRSQAAQRVGAGAMSGMGRLKAQVRGTKLKFSHWFLLWLCTMTLAAVLVGNGIFFGWIIVTLAMAIPAIKLYLFLTSNPLIIVLSVLVAACLAILVLFFFWSGAMYAELGAKLAGATGPVFEVGDLSIGIPGLSWMLWPVVQGANLILKSMQGTLFGLIGFFLFLLVQSTEVVSVVVNHCLPVREAIIKFLVSQKRYTNPDSKDKELGDLVLRHNEYPVKLRKAIDTAAAIAYGIDIVVSLVQAPFLKGGYDAWSELRYTFGMGSFDYGNIVLGSFTVFGFSAVALLICQIINLYIVAAPKD